MDELNLANRIAAFDGRVLTVTQVDSEAAQEPWRWRVWFVPGRPRYSLGEASAVRMSGENLPNRGGCCDETA